ncbi:MAG: hypothetical protein ACR2PG_03180 [Hyphomicrobiaceae bacterium]
MAETRTFVFAPRAPPPRETNAEGVTFASVSIGGRNGDVTPHRS